MSDLTADERCRLATYLTEYAVGVVEEWLRIVDLDQDDDDGPIPARIQAIQGRVGWQSDGTFTFGSTPYSDEYGTYRLSVRVEPIDVAPIGPENDPALAHELETTPEIRMQWVTRTMNDVRTGDRIRLRGTEAVVESAYRNNWHVHPSSRYTVIPLEHSDVLVRLLGRDKAYQFTPDLTVDICLTEDEVRWLDRMGWGTRVCVISEAVSQLTSGLDAA